MAAAAAAATEAERIEAAVLTALSGDAEASIADTLDFAREGGWEHQQLVGVVKSLETAAFVQCADLSRPVLALSAEGRGLLQAGASPEHSLLRMVADAGEEGVEVDAVKAELGADVVKIAMGPAMKQRWLRKQGTRLVALVDPGDTPDALMDLLRAVQAGDGHQALSAAEVKTVKKRQLAVASTLKSMQVSRGESYAPERVRLPANISRPMLEDGSWQTQEFKPYNFNALGAPPEGGSIHPLLKVRAEFRRIMMEMGFEEMPTQKWVESGFWNFDSLFVPQSHPARDDHDTFYIKEPAAANGAPPEYYERVRQTHENGGDTGSIGHRREFSREETMKNLLRTHTTAISAQMLYKLANQEGGFRPAKYFSIDRVFRNESMDATHLCEFHQVEGVVADENVGLSDLLGTIHTFFRKMGITRLRFKPCFNPYTEPSLEIHGYHPGLKRFCELGNSGVFRPEMLQPMGLPEGVRVLGWGLSLERPTMIKYGINNIRELFGHRVDVQAQQTTPIARFV